MVLVCFTPPNCHSDFRERFHLISNLATFRRAKACEAAGTGPSVLYAVDHPHIPPHRAPRAALTTATARSVLIKPTSRSPRASHIQNRYLLSLTVIVESRNRKRKPFANARSTDGGHLTPDGIHGFSLSTTSIRTKSESLVQPGSVPGAISRKAPFQARKDPASPMTNATAINHSGNRVHPACTPRGSTRSNSGSACAR